MAEKPDEAGGSAETGPAPWPVVGRSMINYNPESTGRFPAPVGSAPHGGEKDATVRWPWVLLGLVVFVAVMAVLAYMIVA
ncbi:hypothetical protein [Lentzea sp. NPDC055074]